MVVTSCGGPSADGAPVEVFVPRPPRNVAPPSPPPPRRARLAEHQVELEPEAAWTDEPCGAEVTSLRIRLDGGEPWSTSDCAGTFDALHREGAGVLAAPPFALTISPVAVVSGGTPLLSLKDTCTALLDDFMCETDFQHTTWSLFSMVGPIVTLRVFTGEAGGGGPPYSREEWPTIDLRTGRPAALDALVTTESILAALKAEGALAENLVPEDLARVHAATTLGELLAVPGLASLRSGGSFGSYAFTDADELRGRVTMCIGIRWWYAGMSPNALEPSHLVVEPRPEARAWFAAARRGAGHLHEGSCALE